MTAGQHIIGQRALALLLVLALHLLLLIPIWQLRSIAVEPVHPQSRLLVQLLSETKPVQRPPHMARPERSSPTPAVAKAIPPLVLPSSIDESAQSSMAAVATPPPAASAASSPWLDPEQTRRVIRMLAKQVPITEQAALASQAPKKLTSTERLGQQIQSAATKECLKGEFAGAGMGLLSLPFWALAEAQGKCRR